MLTTILEFLKKIIKKKSLSYNCGTHKLGSGKSNHYYRKLGIIL